MDHIGSEAGALSDLPLFLAMLFVFLGGILAKAKGFPMVWCQRGATSWDWQFGWVWLSIRQFRFWRTSGPGFIRLVPLKADKAEVSHRHDFELVFDPPDSLCCVYRCSCGMETTNSVEAAMFQDRRG